MQPRPTAAGLLLAVPVLLIHAVPWLASLATSREPLMGLIAVFPWAYYFFWLAVASTTAVEFVLLGVCLTAASLPTVYLSWLCVSLGWELFEHLGPPVFGPLLGLALVSIANGAIVAAPLMLIEACLVTPPSPRFRPIRHLLGGAAVLPFTALAMLLHMGVIARNDGLNGLLVLPTPLLILAHFLIEAGRAVPHALATLPPGRQRRAWALLPAVVVAGWLFPLALNEIG